MEHLSQKNVAATLSSTPVMCQVFRERRQAFASGRASQRARGVQKRAWCCKKTTNCTDGQNKTKQRE